ncbi:unnamed protein product [Arctia plantaginis]|uniref:Uncharacterized protein n=1 Tax=Arctia plantaginis TaxID=874455 RepID=A0A8S0ZJ56_ARCPL|nr:unnamed protein product [Arctia plantaginis]CAB3238570.1 unnamed protein product [Arctia plantaginis]
MYVADNKMKDKVVIITGANTGIGFVTAKELAKREAKVILACRDPQKGLAARDKIIQSTGNKNVFLKPLDLTSFISVQEFASEILKTEPKLDVLINNAGTGTLDNSLTRDNLPIEAQVNHFSPFLLTILLLPLLKSSAPSRIINVSSIMHKFGTIDWLDRQAKNRWQHRRVYSNTKLANLLFTKKLSEILSGTGVTVNSLHPGAVNTDIFRSQWFFVRFLLSIVFLTPFQGAQTSIYLAVAPNLKSVSGKYFSNCTEVTPSKKAQDDEAADKLWKMSESLIFRDKKSI